MKAKPGSQWREDASRALAGYGHRAGGARASVVDLLSRQNCCLSAQEIFDRLRAEGSGVGIASVYRALDALHGLGFVQRTDLGQGTYLFEPVTPGGSHHHHVVCERCGKVTPFEDEELESVIERVGSELRHRLGEHEVVIRGRCAGCETRPARA